jgi:predicted RND superfamily exporter protein
VLLLLVTAGVAWPMLFWQPTETASQAARTEVTVTQELVAERFADEVFRYLLLVEAGGGDMLDRAPLMALLENTAAMRTQAGIEELLVVLRDPSLGIDALGAWSLADSVDRLLRQVGVGTGLADADEAQVDAAVAAILGESDPLDWGLATTATRDAAGVWHSPALFVSVAVDNAALGGGGFLVTIGSDDLRKEELARTLRDAIEGDGSVLAAWAPAADVNLTSIEQGEMAGPYIGATIAVVLLIVGVAFRSYWAVAVAGAALAMLMVWLRGGANLIGLENDQILATILPISMISFGIDSAFHGISRVREEARRGAAPQRSFVVGLGAVFGALALAASSDAAAFLANATAGIESVVQFGVAAALATLAAFVLLGVGTPLLLTLIEERTDGRSITRFGTTGEMVLSLLAAALATTTALILVFVSAELGLALLAVYLLAAIVLPTEVARRRGTGLGRTTTSGTHLHGLGRVVGSFAARPILTLMIAMTITAAAVWSALQLEVTFDVKDFFSPDSEFVVALDKTAEYLGDQGGEPVVVYVETDLSLPEALHAIRLFTQQVAAVDGPLARDVRGEVRIEPGVLGLVDDLGDQPANPEDLAAAYERALSDGVVDAQGAALWTANEVGTVLWRGSGGDYATVLTYQIPDTRNQANVEQTRALLEPMAADLETALRSLDSDSSVVVTGSAIYRDDQLDGIRRAMLVALPIALAACFVIAAGFMRSIRYALVSVVPIVLVVTWLFGIMQVAGYSINVVTAIIGAVSIGIGIDFSTHFAMRFLEETRSGASRQTAIVGAGTSTGAALAGSAVTSVAGFGILAFAPMPMFATYGLLTAIMIVLALLASLFVLPSLLTIVTPAGPSGQAHRVVGRVIDLRHGDSPAIRVGLARDLSEGTVSRILDALENGLRSGDVMVRTVPGPALPGLVTSGEVDLALVVVWPGEDLPGESALETLSLAPEALVAVGGLERIAGDSVAIADLVHGLLIAGPHPEFEEGVIRLVSRQAGVPVLGHTVADVATGLRVAGMTGGMMVVPESMARGGGLPVRALEPPLSIRTVLVTTPQRTTDPEVLATVVAIHEALRSDKADFV